MKESMRLVVLVGAVFVVVMGCRTFRTYDHGALPFPAAINHDMRGAAWVPPGDLTAGEGRWVVPTPKNRVSREEALAALRDFLANDLFIGIDIKTPRIAVYMRGKDVVASNGPGNALARAASMDYTSEPLFYATFDELVTAYRSMCDPNPADGTDDCPAGFFLGTCPLPPILSNDDRCNPLEGINLDVGVVEEMALRFSDNAWVEWRDPTFPGGVPRLVIGVRAQARFSLPWYTWFCREGGWSYADVEVTASVRTGEGRCELAPRDCGNGVIDTGEACDDGGAGPQGVFRVDRCPDDCTQWTWTQFRDAMSEPSDPSFGYDPLYETPDLTGTPKNLGFEWFGATTADDFTLDISAGVACWLSLGFFGPWGSILLANWGEDIENARQTVGRLGQITANIVSAYLSFSVGVDEREFELARRASGPEGVIGPAALRVAEGSAGATAMFWSIFSEALQRGDMLSGGYAVEYTGIEDAVGEGGERAVRLGFDADRDCDGWHDDEDDCPLDPDPLQEDADGDTIGDACDLCPDTPSGWPGNADHDGDGLGDACDDDDDNDGCPDAVDRLPYGIPGLVTTPHDTDGDTVPDDCDPDIDGDGWLNEVDNCENVANPGQEDADGDGRGDVCDSDADGDGVPDLIGGGPFPGGDGSDWDTMGDGLLLMGCLRDPGGCFATAAIEPLCPPNVECCRTCSDSFVNVASVGGVSLWSQGARAMGVGGADARRMTGAVIGPWEHAIGSHIALGFPIARTDAAPPAFAPAFESVEGTRAKPPRRRLGKVLVLAAGGTVVDEIVGPQADAEFGAALAPVADFLAVGAPASDYVSWTDCGAVHLVRAGRIVATWWGTRQGERFGETLAVGDDIDGDGIPELLVGAPGSSGLAGKPRVYILSITAGVLSAIDAAKTDGMFGRAGLAWLDETGGPRIVAGAPNSGSWSGLQYGLADAFDTTGRWLWRLPGDSRYQHFGWSVASGSDVDHNGISELVIGGPGDWAGQSLRGRIRIENRGGPASIGSSAGAGVAYDVRGPGAYLWGYSAVPVGDVNGDGFVDLGISLPLQASSAAGHRGRWYVLTGLGKGQQIGR
jgi:hypothetical protein